MDKCKDILEKGVFNEFHLTDRSQFRRSLKQLFEFSYDELRRKHEEASFEAGASIPLAEAFINLGAEYEQSKKEYNRLRERFKASSDEQFEAVLSLDIQRRVASDEIVNAWKECMTSGYQRGLRSRIIGGTGTFFQPETVFGFQISYLPEDQQDPDTLKVANVTVSPLLTLEEPIILEPGVRIPAYSSITQKVRRTGRAGISIAVDMEGRPGITWHEEALAPPPPRRHRVDFGLDAYGVWPLVKGDAEMDTDSGDRVTGYCTTTLSHNERELSLRVSFRCAEYGGDNTTFDGKKDYPLLSVSEKERIVGVEWGDSPVCQFANETVGERHDEIDYDVKGTYWSSLKYKIDNRGDDDKIVGVRGQMAVTALIQQVGP